MPHRLARAVACGMLTVLTVGATAGSAYAKGHKAASTSGATCALSAATFGSTFQITGSGYTSGNSYEVEITWPTTSVSQTGVAADSAGNISTWAYAYYHGTYTVTVNTPNQVLATCTMTVS